MRDFAVHYKFVETDESYVAQSEYDANVTIVMVNTRKFTELDADDKFRVIAHEACHAFMNHNKV